MLVNDEQPDDTIFRWVWIRCPKGCCGPSWGEVCYRCLWSDTLAVAERRGYEAALRKEGAEP
jgi:hypothetical protein